MRDIFVEADCALADAYYGWTGYDSYYPSVLRAMGKLLTEPWYGRSPARYRLAYAIVGWLDAPDADKRLELAQAIREVRRERACQRRFNRNVVALADLLYAYGEHPAMDDLMFAVRRAQEAYRDVVEADRTEGDSEPCAYIYASIARDELAVELKKARRIKRFINSTCCISCYKAEFGDRSAVVDDDPDCPF